MTKRRTRIRVDESGFTLLEMVIAIVISTMILGAMAAVFVTSADSTTATKHRSNQNDAQVIASFLIRDAQAAGGIDPLTGLNDPTLGVFTNAAGDVHERTVIRSRARCFASGGSTQHQATPIDAVYWLAGNTLTRSDMHESGPAARDTASGQDDRVHVANVHGHDDRSDQRDDQHRRLQRRQHAAQPPDDRDARLGAPLDHRDDQTEPERRRGCRDLYLHADREPAAKPAGSRLTFLRSRTRRRPPCSCFGAERVRRARAVPISAGTAPSACMAVCS